MDAEEFQVCLEANGYTDIVLPPSRWKWIDSNLSWVNYGQLNIGFHGIYSENVAKSAEDT